MADWGRLHRNLRRHESERLQALPRSMVLQDPASGAVWTIPDGQTRHVGRHEQAEIRLDGKRVSRKHCLLDFSGEVLNVTNLSPRGLRLNGAKLDGPATARVGDVLRVGRERELRLVGITDPAAPTHVDGRLRVPIRVPPRFLLVRPVGRGAAGTVYDAVDEESGKRYAVKVLSAGGYAGVELLSRFRREVELQRTLRDYPGIVTMFELGTIPETGELFAVMEFVDGCSLATRLGSLSPVEGARVLGRVARAVHFAHAHGLVHRDLKPGNVMLGRDDSVRLADFGLCRALEQPDGLTATGVTLGTPHYMAPEQVDDSRHAGPPADVYALGVMLYRHLTGRLPFEGDDIGQVIDLVCAGAFAPPRDVKPGVPVELDALCLRAMSYAPEARTTAQAFAKDLEAWARRIDPPSRVSLIAPE